MGIELRRFTWNYLDLNIHVFMAELQALAIDPIDSEEAFDHLRSFHEITVFLIHEHFNHICGVNRI